MKFSDKYYFFFLVLIFVVYVCALPVPIMEVDAAQYAAMSIQLLQKGDFLHFMDGGRQYLDKPPLVFWTAALSYAVFGINSVAYRLPSLIFWMLGVYSVYRFTLLHYNEKTAKIAALVLGGSLAGFMLTMDCRTDTLLTGAMAFSIWQLSAYIKHNKWLNFFGAFTGIALSMLAKGPIGVVIPVMTFGLPLLLTRQWKMLFRWEWLLGAVWVLLLLSPMMWGLYTQFDLHPELIVNGENNVSGLKFYFWTQSFGRITGENVWKDTSGFDFFWHTNLWAFLPWGLMLYVSLWHGIKKCYLYIVKGQTAPEFYSLFGFLLPLLALSTSQYKLPHYIFVTYPMGAVMIAAYIEYFLTQTSKEKKFWMITQGIIAVLFAVVGALIALFVFPSQWILLVSIASGIVTVGIYFACKESAEARLLYPSVWGMLALCWILNVHFYPRLLKYQGCTNIGEYMKKYAIPVDKTYINLNCACFVDMPIQQRLKGIGSMNVDSLAQISPIYILSDLNFHHQLTQQGQPSEVVFQSDDYPVTHLTPAFLHQKTRPQTLQNKCLLKISPKTK